MQQSTTETARPRATKLITGCGLAAMAAIFITAWLTGGGQAPALLGIRAEFYLFAITLIGVALLHHYSLQVALAGLAAILLFKFAFTDFHLLHHL